MAPSFFLKQFGISAVSKEYDGIGDTLLLNEPKKMKKIPKISPLGFEISNDDSTSIIGSQVYVRVNGDADNPSSCWEDVYKDDDGDPTIDIDIEDAVNAHNIYVKIANNLVKVPGNMRGIDKDGDIQVDATNLFLSGLKLSNLMVKVEEPSPTPNGWQVGKFLFDAYGKMHYKTATNWEEMLMPVDDSFVSGYYVFK
jgi:hypothetical protein